MIRSRTWWLVVFSFAALSLSPVLAQSPGRPAPPWADRLSPEASAGNHCRIFALSDLGGDADFCNWVAATIPQVIQPESWTPLGGKGNLSYYPPSKTLVVYHTADAHAQVDAFLKNIKKTLPQENGKSVAHAGSQAPALLQAQYVVPKDGPTPDAAPPYLIPAPAKQPKHLFHFVLRYEGDGAPEANSQDKGKAEVTADSPVVQAQNVVSRAIASGDAAPLGAYVMPALAKSKQLFHCIVRYEGEGIIDSNVVELFKAYAAAESAPPPPMLAPAPDAGSKAPEPLKSAPRSLPPTVTPSERVPAALAIPTPVYPRQQAPVSP